MGRTFGLVIVSIGLWLVFSLPTRAPVPDQRGSTVAGTPEYTSRPAVPTALLAPVAAAVTADAPTTAIRTTAADTTVVARPSRTLGERNHAARSREIESEPEAAMQRPPEPVALTISAANLVAAGTNQNSPSTAEQAIPAPKPVARRDARALPKPEMKNGAAGMTAQKADAGPGAPLAPGSQSPGASTPGSLTQAAIKVPRIFEVVRRDLAASGHVSLAARPQTSGPSALSSANPGPHPPMVAAGTNKTIRSTSARLQEGDTLAIKVPAHIPVTSKSTAKVASTTSDGSEKTQGQTILLAKPKDAKRNEASKPAKPAFAKPAPRLAAVQPSLPPRRVWVAQVYSPPLYVGRVVVRSFPPPAYYVPSSGSSRRSQFRGEVTWDFIRRGGM